MQTQPQPCSCKRALPENILKFVFSAILSEKPFQSSDRYTNFLTRTLWTLITVFLFCLYFTPNILLIKNCFKTVIFSYPPCVWTSIWYCHLTFTVWDLNFVHEATNWIYNSRFNVNIQTKETENKMKLRSWKICQQHINYW